MATIRSTGIFWEASDREAIIKHAYAFVKAKGIKVPFERGSILLDVTDYAQRQALDKKFHRPMTNSTSYMWVQDGILELMEKQTIVEETVDTRTLDILMPLSSLELSEADKKEIERKIRDTNSSMWGMIKEEVRKTPIIVSLVDSLAEMLADDILIAVQKRLLEQQGKLVVPPAEVKAEPVKLVPDLRKKPEAPQPPERKKKHVVSLIGLLPDQFSMMEREFGDKLDLRHVGSDDVRKTEIFDTTDMLFVMIKFVNHSTTNKIQKRCQKYQYVNSGLSDLRAKINTYIQENRITV